MVGGVVSVVLILPSSITRMRDLPEEVKDVTCYAAQEVSSDAISPNAAA